MLSRREFVSTTALLTTSPWIATSIARAHAASDRITLGFIGVGKKGLGHLNQFLGNQQVEVVAVCDVVKDRVDHAIQTVKAKYAERTKSGEYRGLKAFVDFRELLGLDGLDAVVIGTPDHWHAIQCILSARAGKHIYCEKPLTHNVAEGRQLVSEVAKAGVVFQTGSQQRSEFGDRFRKAVEYIWNGRIGDLKRIRIGVGEPAKPCDLATEDVPEGTDWNMWVGPAPMRGYNQILCPQGVHQHFPKWRAYQEYAGGALADMGAHHFDIAQWAMKTDSSGPVKVVPPLDRSAESGLKFIYSSGIEMIHNQFEGDVKADCVFEGTNGMLLVSRNGISTRPSSILEEPLTESDQRVMQSSSHHQNWIDAIRSGGDCICTAEIGHRSATICHLGNIGYRLGRELAWDPASERFTGDEDANMQLSRAPRPEWSL